MQVHRTFVLLVLMFAAGLVQAQRPVQFYWENDIGVLTKGTDEYYTNGLRLSVGDRDTPEWANTFRTDYCASRLRPCRGMGALSTAAVAYAFTHQFWTPQVKTISTSQPLDRPWAGYMYLSANLQILDQDDENEQHVIEAQVGVLGPAAGAQFVQTEWHRLIKSPKPLGWANQLKNEPVLNLLYTQNYRIRRRGSESADLVVSPGGMVGTLFIYPSIAVTGRLGRHISGFPAVPLAPAAGGTRSRSTWEAYLHAGAEARRMIHNATLDGGAFRDGPSVDRSTGVYDLRGGFSVRIFTNWRVTGTVIRRSEEFRPPPGRGDNSHYYNSLVVAYEPQR